MDDLYPAWTKASKVALAWISEHPKVSTIFPSQGVVNRDEDIEDGGLPFGLLVSKEVRDFVMSRCEKTNVWERYKSWRAELWGWRRIWLYREDVVVLDRRCWRFLVVESMCNLSAGGGVFPRSVVRRVVVAAESVDLEGNEDVEERKRKEGERNGRQILGVLDVFEMLKEVKLLVVGRDGFVEGGQMILCAQRKKNWEWSVVDGNKFSGLDL